MQVDPAISPARRLQLAIFYTARSDRTSSDTCFQSMKYAVDIPSDDFVAGALQPIQANWIYLYYYIIGIYSQKTRIQAVEYRFKRMSRIVTPWL
jgi:hypothetical protein